MVWAEQGGFCIDTALFVDRRSTTLDLRYAFYLLQTLGLDEPSKDSAVPGLDRSDAHNKPIPSHSCTDQQAIAAFLDRETARIDQLIAKKERLVGLLIEKRKAAIKGLVFGQHLDLLMTPSGVQWIPDLTNGWVVQRLSRLFDFLDHIRVPLNSEERADLEKIYPYYGASGIIDKVDRYLFDEDLILVGEDGANLVMQSTLVAFIATGKYWVNNHAHILRPRSGPLEFWVHVLNQVPYEIYVTGSAQPKLTAEALRSLPLPVPPLTVQYKLAEQIGTVSRMIDKLLSPIGASIERLRELRSALITAAVTGQIDVATWGNRGETDRRLDAIELELATEPAGVTG
ncbi:MAG: restriction endonuclease subunit S [Chloroflexota bacterium]|nr:restriction endonuclease subunit S [Chloroflexota bacterium]